MLRRLLFVVMALSAVACSPSFSAPPHLIAVWPAPGATLSVSAHTLDLTFNRPLKADASRVGISREGDGLTVETSLSIDPANPRRVQVRLLKPAAGSFLLHWHVVAAHGGDTADGEQTFSMRNESKAPARLDVSPGTADVDKPLDVVGKDFAAKSLVQLTMGDDGQPLSSVETDADGKFSTQVKVPPSVPFGIQSVLAVDSQGKSATAAIDIRWGGWPPVVASDLGQPGPDAGQVSFTLNVRNRSDYLVEHVRVVLKDPDGGTLVGADPEPLHEDGGLVWVIPVMDRGVVGPFRATYRASVPVVGHAWLEFRHRHTGACGRDDCLPAFISESVADSGVVEPAD